MTFSVSSAVPLRYRRRDAISTAVVSRAFWKWQFLHSATTLIGSSLAVSSTVRNAASNYASR
jgi:hypothetical protein